MVALPVDARYRICVALHCGGLRSVDCGVSYGVSCVARVGSRSRKQGSPPKGEKALVDRTVKEGGEVLKVLCTL
jgi:hypothetical protein